MFYSSPSVTVLVSMGKFFKAFIMGKNIEITYQLITQHENMLITTLDYLNSAQLKIPGISNFMEFIFEGEKISKLNLPELASVKEYALKRQVGLFLFDYLFSSLSEDYSSYVQSVHSTFIQIMIKLSLPLLDEICTNSCHTLFDGFVYNTEDNNQEKLESVVAFLSEFFSLIKSIPAEIKQSSLNFLTFRNVMRMSVEHIFKYLSPDFPIKNVQLRKNLILAHFEIVNLTAKRRIVERSDLMKDPKLSELIDLIIQFEDYSTFPYNF